MYQDQNIYLLAITHKTAPLAIRENFAISEQDITPLYDCFIKAHSLEECLILNTCNRVEVYVVSKSPLTQEQLIRTFCDYHDIPFDYLSQYCFWLEDQAAISHLFQVACGLDSQMVGETEILGQLKAAYARAQNEKYVKTILNKSFQKSFQTAKWIRTHTAIGKGQTSIGNVAVELAIRIFGELDKCRILVIGTGEAGQLTLQAIRSRGGQSVTISSRTLGKARLIAAKYGGVAVDSEQVAHLVRYFDIVICATSADHAILNHAMIDEAMRERRDEPLFLIDQAVPRDIEDSVAKLTNVYLYNLDDLANIANENLKSRQAEVEKCMLITAEKASYLWASLTNRRIDASVS